MEIGLGGAVGECPIARAAVAGLDHGGQADVENGARRQQFRGDHGVKAASVGAAVESDLWRDRWNEPKIALAAGGEAIVCPLAGRREVEFTVFRAVDRSNEGFETGVLPQTIAGGG